MDKQNDMAQLRYLEEAAISLKRAGFETGRIEDHHLPVNWNGSYLCRISGKGSALYRQQNVDANGAQAELADLNPAQQTAFAGLLKMEIEKRDGDILVPKLIDLAYSVDCCHVVAEALNDAQLGRFYADNGFIPITENVPDSVYELLDFEALGRKARNEEGGVFVDRGTYGCCGYVVRHTDLVEAYKTMALAPRTPPYTVLLELTKG